MAPTVNIPLSSEARSLLDALTRAGHGAAIVGGAVRDALLGRNVRDLDVVTDADPDAVRTACERKSWCARVYTVGERYGTVGVVLREGAVVEVSRLRGDPPNPRTSFAERFASDAEHRDFTVNAMAAEWPSLALLDPLGGIQDAHTKVLRAPGDPAARFAEDPLRVLRAARFAAQLGFEVEAATAVALPAATRSLDRVASERIRDEVTALLVAPDAARGLTLLHSCGALAVVLPEVAALDGLEQPTFHDLDALSHTIQAVAAAPSTPVLRWVALLHDIGKAPARTVEPDGRIRFFRHAQQGAELAEHICERLRFSKAERTAIVHLVREHMRLGELPLDNPRAVDRAVRRLDLWLPGTDSPRRLVTAEDALEIEMADFASTAHRGEALERRRALEAAVTASRERGTRRPPSAPLSGRELMEELSLEEGPTVGAALRAVEDAVAEGLLAAHDRVGAIEIARRAAGEHPLE